MIWSQSKPTPQNEKLCLHIPVPKERVGGAAVCHRRTTEPQGRQGEESALVALPIQSLRRRSKGTRLVAPPFAAVALTGCQVAGAREPTTLLKREERAAASATTAPPMSRRTRKPPVLPEREQRAGRATAERVSGRGM